jgi:hypothetical protein
MLESMIVVSCDKGTVDVAGDDAVRDSGDDAVSNALAVDEIDSGTVIEPLAVDSGIVTIVV